ncbi:MAG TPA: alpha/beta hydrolase [Acidiphilium sp.]|nr:alpha/beta hydrolase [Acidiphilium sp.]
MESPVDERMMRVTTEAGELAAALLAGEGPVVVFLPGFASDMQGTKALFLRDECAARGRAMLRLDYSGHGNSGGRFEAGTIGRWAADAEAVIAEAVPAQDLVLVGSSMGGWIGLLLARRLGALLAGFVGIAAAPDFTAELMEPAFDDAARAALARDGILHLPNPYGAPTPITAALLEDGRRNLVLGGPIPIDAPVRLIQGQRDAEVPWRTALRIAEAVRSTDVRVTLVKDGEHRLSRPQDLALIAQEVFSI